MLSISNAVILDVSMECDLWPLKGKVSELCMIMRVIYMILEHYEIKMNMIII